MNDIYGFSLEQKEFFGLLKKIVTLLQQFKFKDQQNDTYVLWELFEQPYTLNDIVEQKPFFTRIKKLFQKNILGTLNQLRADILNQFQTKQFYLQSYDGVKIDCVYIQCEKQSPLQFSPDQTLDGNEKPLIQETSSKDKVIIYCNPNGGYYENLFYDSDWLEFYLKKGINLLVWNYRGYGNSQGIPTTYNIFKDCEYIVDYLRKNFQIKNIGIHGQSLGGLVATYTADQKKLNFLCADRTFSKFSQVALHSFGPKASKAFQLLTDWDFDSSYAYLKANCYKIITVDPKDEVLPFLSSLLNGVVYNFGLLSARFNDFPRIRIL
ncbi:hypothetical protein IMG5_008710 [Ichthyophthirius multifiliis]|uniref:Serine aminopeptidase S33 domain-containing protein n=1 Tax=Ichthyophthirius multifiliis TaxID=5932 RepID=G0QJS9_ICHMU|nr:hypothetical protein IMG5_008710 [Ichthyophthirius multifiliis]EGR34522.1 hypothetical protein IMG5_008710 [Ichthyophthirius multifiliis]|eukprot:XP_004039826.1 hypothetical protein IMG5_008710 [Ichthyophthirius multifiliis]